MITWSSAGPSTEPLTSDDVKNYLRIDTQTNDDDLVTGMIVAARQACEKFTGLFLITQTVTQTMDEFASWTTIHIVKGPVQSVTSVTTYDVTGTPTVLDDTTYVADAVGERIVMKNGAVLPLIGQYPQGGVVVYVAGFGTASDVPAPLVQGMRHLIAAMYENRETAVDLPPLVRSLWMPYKKFSF